MAITNFDSIGLADGLIVGAIGTLMTQFRVYSQALNVVSVAANTSAEQTFTVTGLTTADKVTITKPTLTAGIVIGGARVSAANTLNVQFGNLTAAPIVPGAELYTIVALRS